MNDLAQEFLDTVSSYEHFALNAMDVEQHAEWLALCFHMDGVRPEPSREQIRRLIASLVEEIAIPKGLPALLQTRFAPGVFFDERTHPRGRITLLPVGTVVMIFDHYVFSLGALAGKPPTTANRQAGYWIDPEWTFIVAFVDRFYDCVAEVMHKGDREERHTNGYSSLEVMRLGGLREGIDAEAILKQRVHRVRELRSEMEEALRKEAHKEAVAIQEALFTRLLSDALEIHGLPVPSRLVEIVSAAEKLSHEWRVAVTGDFWPRLDQWRKKRNLVIHAPRESIFLPPAPGGEAHLRSMQAALDGALLVPEVEAWSIEVRARSLDLSLPRPTRSLLTH